MIPFKKQYLNFSNLQIKLGGRSRSSIYRDLKRGRIPAPVKIGARLYWVEEDIDAALSSGPNNPSK